MDFAMNQFYDFMNKTAEEFQFVFDTVLMEE